MTDDTIQKSDALEYVLENHWDEVKEKVLDEICGKIQERIDEIKSFLKLHSCDTSKDFKTKHWHRINELKYILEYVIK